jgi:hypothetical protein
VKALNFRNPGGRTDFAAFSAAVIGPLVDRSELKIGRASPEPLKGIVTRQMEARANDRLRFFI